MYVCMYVCMSNMHVLCIPVKDRKVHVLSIGLFPIPIVIKCYVEFIYTLSRYPRDSDVCDIAHLVALPH